MGGGELIGGAAFRKKQEVVQVGETLGAGEGVTGFLEGQGWRETGAQLQRVPQRGVPLGHLGE